MRDYRLYLKDILAALESVAIPGRTRAIVGNCATTSPATHGTLASVANASYELLEPGTSYKPDFGHEKGI
jgi:hypothetical protein